MPIETKRALLGKRDWLAALATGVAALALYAFNAADYVYPGESAHLAAVWGGLDTSSFGMYPLAHAFTDLFGRFAPPVFGALAVSFSSAMAQSLLIGMTTASQGRPSLVTTSGAGFPGV